MRFLKLPGTEPTTTLPASCKTTIPARLDYARKTFPADEMDKITIEITGKVEWQAMVEVQK